jgi:hypothetical protein
MRADLDDVAPPPDEVQLPDGIQSPNFAGAEPALAQHRGGGCRVAPLFTQHITNRQTFQKAAMMRHAEEA